MIEPPDVHARPAERVAELTSQLGTDAVVRWCAGLLAAETAYDDPALPSLSWLGGTAAPWLLGQVEPQRSVNAYWARVWAGRGLLHVYTPTAARHIVGALGDDAWRVREMAAKVVARWEVADAADDLVPLVRDEVTRVRAAAVRALGVVGEGEHSEVVKAAVADPESTVCRAAAVAITALQRRLDREL